MSTVISPSDSSLAIKFSETVLRCGFRCGVLELEQLVVVVVVVVGSCFHQQSQGMVMLGPPL
jgi:hypothetical protein